MVKLCECKDHKEEDVVTRRRYRYDSYGDILDYTDYMWCKKCGGLIDKCP